MLTGPESKRYPTLNSSWTNSIAGAGRACNPTTLGTLARGQMRHHSREAEVAAKWPLAVDGLPGGKCGGHQLSMARVLDADSDHSMSG